MRTGKLLATEQDCTGTAVEIRHLDEISDSKVVSFFLKNLAILIDNGFSLQLIAGTNRHHAVFAEINGEIVGHIVYEYLEHPVKTAWITLSAIDDNYKRRGLYTLLHKHFEQTIRAAGAKKIASSVHVNNVARHASCKKVGMQPIYYRMEKEL